MLVVMSRYTSKPVSHLHVYGTLRRFVIFVDCPRRYPKVSKLLARPCCLMQAQPWTSPFAALWTVPKISKKWNLGSRHSVGSTMFHVQNSPLTSSSWTVIAVAGRKVDQKQVNVAWCWRDLRLSRGIERIWPELQWEMLRGWHYRHNLTSHGPVWPSLQQLRQVHSRHAPLHWGSDLRKKNALNHIPSSLVYLSNTVSVCIQYVPVNLAYLLRLHSASRWAGMRHLQFKLCQIWFCWISFKLP